MYHHTYTLITLGPPYTTSLSCGFSNRSTVECTIKNRFFLFNGTGYIDKKEHISFPMYKEIQMGAVAKEVLPNIWGNAQIFSHIWLCNRSLQDFLIYEEIFVSFLSVYLLLKLWSYDCRITVGLLCTLRKLASLWHLHNHCNRATASSPSFHQLKHAQSQRLTIEIVSVTVILHLSLYHLKGVHAL
jgi:hypothetical protein